MLFLKQMADTAFLPPIFFQKVFFFPPKRDKMFGIEFVASGSADNVSFVFYF